MRPITEQTEFTLTVLTREDWERKLRAQRASGTRKAQALLKEGRRFVPGVLSPREMPRSEEGKEEKTQFTALTIPLDWKVEMRLEMVELANDFLTKAYTLGSLDSSLQALLAATIEGRITPEPRVPIL